jgi:hypothetical protein
LKLCPLSIAEYGPGKGIVIPDPGTTIVPDKHRIRDRIQEFLTAGDTRR